MPNFMRQESAPYHVPGVDKYWKYFEEKHQKLTRANKENISPLQEDNWLQRYINASITLLKRLTVHLCICLCVRDRHHDRSIYSRFC